MMDRNTKREYRCVSCGAPLEAGDKFCSVCGADQTAARKAQSSASSWRCAKCGALNAEEMAFCTQCGRKRAKPRKSRRWIAWLAALLAVAGLAAFVVLYAYPNLIRPAIVSFKDKRQSAAPAASTQTAAPAAVTPANTQSTAGFSADQSDDGAPEHIPVVPETEPAATPESETAAAPVGPFGPGVLRFAYGASVLIFDGFTDTTGASYVNTEMSGGYEYHFYNELLDMRVDLFEALLKNVLSYGIAVPVAEFTADGYLDARYGELCNRANVIWSDRGEGYCSVMYLSDTMSVLERYIVDRDVVYVLQFRYPQAQAQACYPIADTMIANFVPADHPDYLTPVLAGTQGASTQEAAARRFVDIAVHSEWAYALRDDGTVATTSNEPALQEAVGAWRNVTQIVPGEYAVFGLHADGTVSHCLNVPVGNPEDPYKSVDGWTDIVALSAAHHVLGLKKDGTVVAAGSAYFGSAENYDFSDWKNVTELYDILGMEEGAAALRSDGYVLSLNMPFSWSGEAKNLTALSCAPYLWLGLKNDGTVICRGVDAGLVADEIKGWTSVTQVCAGSGTAAALRADGTVLTAGQFGRNDVGSWRNITAIYLDQNQNLFGVDADGNMHCCCQGTVNPIDEASVGSWKNIVKLCFGWGGSVLGLRADGTLVASGCKIPA